jgi:hypothetical protein
MLRNNITPISGTLFDLSGINRFIQGCNFFSIYTVGLGNGGEVRMIGSIL